MIELNADDEAVILRAVRQVPDTLSDEAWKYCSDRVRAIGQPTVFDIREIADEIVKRYGGRDEPPADFVAHKTRRRRADRWRDFKIGGVAA